MRILYHNAAGDLCVVVAAPKQSLERVLGPLTDEAYRAHVRERSISSGATDVVEVGDDWTPPSREFRNAWKHKDGVVSIDMVKAREIHRERIRANRIPLLQELDVAYQKADESGDAAAKKVIASRKQALRDAPKHPAIDAAKTQRN